MLDECQTNIIQIQKTLGETITETIIQLVVISPLIIISYQRQENKWIYLLLFVLYYLLYKCLLAIPGWIPTLNFFESTWNWSGKTFATVGSIIFYFIFRKLFAYHNFITFKQNDNSFRHRMFIIITIFFVAFGLFFFSGNMQEARFEDLLFQSTMPGMDEELAFRGVLLGLLSNSLKPKIRFGSLNLGNPALLISSALFGFSHSLHISTDWWNIYQNWFEFINTFAIGMILGWIAIKSGSILMSVLVHNLINILPIIAVNLLNNM